MKIYNAQSRLLLDVEVDDNSYRHRVIMGDHNLTLYYSLAEHVELPVGAWCEYQGETYTLERPEALKMKHTRYFEYTITMEAAQSKAGRWKFRNPVDGRLKFPLTAKPHEHLQMFVDNMNMRDTGWSVGECIDGAEHLISYSHNYCLEALAMIASEFDTEFEIVGKRVSLHRVEYNKSNPLPLSYGRGNGFKPDIGRSNSSETPPVEILYTQGGEDNIDASKYGSSELHLPKGGTIGYDGEKFEDEEGYNEGAARHYVVDSDGYSIRRSDKGLSSYAEDSLDCSDIYPKRVGTVSGVVAVDAGKNFYDFTDDSIPSVLDYNKYLIEGETMTVIFQSGMLAGREFEVNYIHEPKSGKQARRFEIVPQEIDGQTMPNATFKPAVNDAYAVFHCTLPDSYISDDAHKSGAEWEMFRTAVKYMFDNEEQKFTFSGSLDGIWSKKDWINIGGKIRLGGYIKFSDERFQKDGVLVRITGIKDYINKPHSPELELSNETVSAGFSSEFKKVQNEDVVVEDNARKAELFTKRRFRDAKETMAMLEASLLDNFTNSVSPIAVQTMQALIGDESLQFRFVDSKTAPNPDADFAIAYNNEAHTLSVTATILQHLTLGITDISSAHATNEYKFWDMAQYESAVMDDPDARYYLYAVCSKTDGTGVFKLSETAVKMEAVEGFYHFLVGILNSEYDGARSFAPLYGFTEILPGRLTTDKIVSSDGKSYLDLISGNMELGEKLKYLNGVLTLDFLFSEGANIGGFIFRNQRLESQDGGLYLDGINGTARLKGTLQHSTATQGVFSDVDLFSLPAQTSLYPKAIDMGNDEEDIGKRCLLTNTSEIGSEGYYKVLTSKFGWKGNVKYIGDRSSYLIAPNETIEMTCFELPAGAKVIGSEVDKGGWWKITKRFYEDIPPVVAMGIVTSYSGGANIEGKSIAGTDFSVTRNGTGDTDGTYTVSLPAIFEKAKYMLISLTGIGVAQNGRAPIKATLISQSGRTFVVRTSDDASDNAGSFSFVVYSFNGWSI